MQVRITKKKTRRLCFGFRQTQTKTLWSNFNSSCQGKFRIIFQILEQLSFKLNLKFHKIRSYPMNYYAITYKLIFNVFLDCLNVQRTFWNRNIKKNYESRGSLGSGSIDLILKICQRLAILTIYLNFKQAFCLDFNWYRFLVWLLFGREILTHIIYLVRFLSFNALQIQGAVFLWCTTSIYKMYKVLNLLHWHSYVFSIIKFVAWIALFDCWTLQFYSFIDQFHIQFCGFRRLLLIAYFSGFQSLHNCPLKHI